MNAALMAFLHHLAAFTVVAALAVEVAVFKPPLTLAQARRLLLTDQVFGLAATAVLVIGLLRVFYFEKGPAYYWHDSFFLAKFTAFVLAGLVSAYPTVVFLSWRRDLRNEVVPQMPAAQVRRIRMCFMWELTAIVVIVLCAAFMARGFGYR